jgi:hypothetical protein
MRELNRLRISIIDDRDQTRACGQHRLMLIRPTPIWVRLGYPSLECGIKVNCEHLRKFLDPQWSNSDSKTMKETIRVMSICLVDVS